MESLFVLVKPASSACNMRCRYCFYADVAGRRSIRNYGMMSPDILAALVEKALAETTKACSFGFQGGEPTLAGLDFYRHLIDLEGFHNKNNVRIFHSIQTNGLAVTPEWAKFWAKNNFLVGISLDADKRRHDEFRVDAAGKGTHNRCLAACRTLNEYKVPYNILAVVTRGLASHPDKTYWHYRDRGFRHLQFIPCLDDLGEGQSGSPHSLDAETYGKFLCRLFDLWLRDYMNGDFVSIRIFDNWIGMLLGQPPESCDLIGRCRPYLLVEGDGTVFPCDFYAVDKYRLGNIVRDSVDALMNCEAANRFAAESVPVHPRCRKCEYYFLCRGGCRRHREPLSEEPSLDMYCESHRRFFAHALPGMRMVFELLSRRGGGLGHSRAHTGGSS
ncbi:MAG: anaerobic sulfatase maturase [Planctomycetota bacterium]|jgi:uncharacterized protein|nr:anaerobic sulfatase maturase [Planctomycetota bacterium]